MKSNHPLYKVICAITVLVLAALACDSPTSTPAPVVVPPAPVYTVIPVALPVSTEPVRLAPVPIGSGDENMSPPATNIIVLNVEAADLQVVNNEVDKYLNGESEMNEASMIGGLLPLILEGINNSLCQDMSSNFVSHLLDKRLKRLGGWLGVERFYTALQTAKFELRAILVSRQSKWNVAFLMVIDGVDHLFVLTTGGGSNTVVPLSVLKSDLVDWLQNRSMNYIERDSANRIVRGIIYADAEVRSILQVGTYALNEATRVFTALSFAKLGKCIEAKVKALPEYQQWEQNGRHDTSRIDVLYETEYDLVMDMQTLQDLGLAHNLVNNAEAERDGLLIISIAGVAVVSWIIAPVVIPAGGAYGLTTETVRYALVIGSAVP